MVCLWISLTWLTVTMASLLFTRAQYAQGLSVWVCLCIYIYMCVCVSSKKTAICVLPHENHHEKDLCCSVSEFIVLWRSLQSLASLLLALIHGFLFRYKSCKSTFQQLGYVAQPPAPVHHTLCKSLCIPVRVNKSKKSCFFEHYWSNSLGSAIDLSSLESQRTGICSVEL